MSLLKHMDTPTVKNLPAIAGGAKAKETPYGSASRYGVEELQELQEALEQQSLFYSQGRKVTTLEEEFAAKVHLRHGIACSSGTAAIHAACIAIGLSPGDEVIVPPITDMGSIVPVLFQGAVPIFADLTPHGYVLDPASVAAKITDRTRAVLAVHLWGNACDLTSLRALCDAKGIFLIEDCAQALGASYQGKPVGGFGHISCFSFNEYKHISCGDGGITLTNDDALALRLRLATDKCYDRRPDVLIRQPTFLANNYRMTELQGAVARAQVRKLDDIVARRRRWVGHLSELLSETPGIALPQATSGADPSWWFYLLRVQPEVLGVDADEFTKAIQAEGLRASAHYIGAPVYKYPIFTKHSAFEHASHPFERVDYTSVQCPVAESILETGVMLPVNEAFTDRDCVEIVRAVRRVADWFVAGGRP